MVGHAIHGSRVAHLLGRDRKNAAHISRQVLIAQIVQIHHRELPSDRDSFAARAGRAIAASHVESENEKRRDS